MILNQQILNKARALSLRSRTATAAPPGARRKLVAAKATLCLELETRQTIQLGAANRATPPAVGCKESANLRNKFASHKKRVFQTKLQKKAHLLWSVVSCLESRARARVSSFCVGVAKRLRQYFYFVGVLSLQGDKTLREINNTQ